VQRLVSAQLQVGRHGVCLPVFHVQLLLLLLLRCRHRHAAGCQGLVRLHSLLLVLLLLLLLTALQWVCIRLLLAAVAGARGLQQLLRPMCRPHLCW
jgi:hypothetical protein